MDRHEYLEKINFKDLRPLRYFKGVFIVFLPQIATLIYTILDKIMLGIICNSDLENGYYAQSQNIIKMLLTVVTSLSIVLMPRIAQLFSKQNTEQITFYLLKALKFVWLFATPMMTGVILLSQTFTIWFLGNEFEKVSLLLCITSPLIVIIGLSSVINTAYLFPQNKQKLITCILFLGSGTNFILNLLLMPKFKSIGATVATVCSELLITLIMLIYAFRKIEKRKLLVLPLKYIFASLIMYIVLIFTSKLNIYTFSNIVLIIFKGAILYFVILLCLKEENILLFILIIKEKIKQK